MKPTVLLISISTLALAMAAPAAPKGPTEATITGPGVDGDDKIVLTSQGDPAEGTPFGALVMEGGFFPAMFGQSPDPMLAKAPEGALGARYTITYGVPGPDNEFDQIRQDMYPYAEAGPVFYTKPGQSFFGTERTRGGWYVAPASLKATLVSLGLPETQPSSSGGDGGFSPRPTIWLAVAFAILLAAATVVVVRRRPRPVAH